MSESEDIIKVVNVLSRLPPKNLKIIELLNRIPIIKGELDTYTLEKLGSEIEDAKAEAEVYRQGTTNIIHTLKGIL
jgi:hypothetical protein